LSLTPFYCLSRIPFCPRAPFCHPERPLLSPRAKRGVSPLVFP
jgi:hypothetical protein